MNHSEIWVRLLPALSSLLVTSKKYILKFDQHSASMVFIEMKKALVKDVSKLVKKVDKHTPLCYLLIFEGFEGIIEVEDIKGYDLVANGIILHFDTYELRIYEDTTI